MPRAILHVDMDAFYASVEQRDDPTLRGRPVIVGGDRRRGVVLAASYEVRTFGVRSAMPMARAMRQAPDAIVVPPRFDAYAEASERVHEIFDSVTPLIEPLSLDEAFLDVTASTSLLGPPGHIASTIRARIADELGLPASAGIASTKFVAKIASDVAKPNGQREVPHEETVAFLAPLPVWRLWGVGPKMAESMQAIGLETIGDVAARDVGWLERRLGQAGRHFWSLAHGVDDRPVVPDREAKSIGAEDTFATDLRDREALGRHVHSQALRVGRRLRRAHVRARVVVLKVKFADFTLITRRTTLPEPSDDGGAIYRAASRLLDGVEPGRAIRLTGVSGHDLMATDAQLRMFDDTQRRTEKLNATLDVIASRFGGRAVVPADLVAEHAPDDATDEARRQAGAARFDLARDQVRDRRRKAT